MAYRFDTAHLNGQQRAIINQRDRNNELMKKAAEERNELEKPNKKTETLSDEQLNFLTRLKVAGPQHYSILGDRIGDDEAIKQLYKLKEDGLILFDGVDASITGKGLDLVKDRDSYML